MTSLHTFNSLKRTFDSSSWCYKAYNFYKTRVSSNTQNYCLVAYTRFDSDESIEILRPLCLGSHLRLFILCQVPSESPKIMSISQAGTLESKANTFNPEMSLQPPAPTDMSSKVMAKNLGSKIYSHTFNLIRQYQIKSMKEEHSGICPISPIEHCITQILWSPN